MKNIILTLNSLVSDSKRLLAQDTVGKSEVDKYMRDCSDVFYSLIAKSKNELVVDQAEQGLDYEVSRIDNGFLRWGCNYLTEAINSFTFNAPYLRKKTDSDYYKTYVFWTKKRLEDLLRRLNNSDS